MIKIKKQTSQQTNKQTNKQINIFYILNISAKSNLLFTKLSENLYWGNPQVTEILKSNKQTNKQTNKQNIKKKHTVQLCKRWGVI